MRSCLLLVGAVVLVACSGVPRAVDDGDPTAVGSTVTTTPSPWDTTPTSSVTASPSTAEGPGPGPGVHPSSDGTREPRTVPAPTPSATETTPPPPSGGASFAGCPVFPADNPWNQRVDDLPVHPNSDDFIDSIGRGETMHPDFGTEWQGAPIGIPYTTVPGDQPRVPVAFNYASESDRGPYPIPPDAPVEAGSDRHVIVIDTDNCVLWELFDASTDDGGASWDAGSGARFDLRSNALRPAGWTSADAAGLPIFAGLVRWEEVVEDGVIDHALRFTVSQTQRGYVHPARHWASDSTNADHPPMGLRLRMKGSYSCANLASEVRVICTALKRYGMFVADNGSDWFLSGAPDPRWNDDRLRDLKDIPGDAFEVVDTGPVVTD